MRLLTRSAIAGILLSLIAPSTNAAELKFTFDQGRTWKLKPETRASFQAFLERERQNLLQAIPGLAFPASFAKQNDILPYVFGATLPDFPDAPSEKNYLNRSASCSFLDKVRRDLNSDEAREHLARMTQNGKICIAGDLDPSQSENWTLEMARFLWGEAWIRTGDRTLSLEALIVSNMKFAEFQRPAILPLRGQLLEGFGYGQSQADHEFVEKNSALRRVFEIASQFNPNEPKTLGDLGPELAALIQGKPGYLGNPWFYGEPFIAGPSIYLTANWPPEALVELLAHEYAHAYQLLHTRRLKGDETAVTYFNDHVHFEGAAEAFAWMNLRALYARYPEIETFHVLKLKYMNQHQTNDNHYVGAAALHSLFHSESAGSFEELKRFIEAPSLADYLRENGLATLENAGAKPPIDVQLTF